MSARTEALLELLEAVNQVLGEVEGEAVSEVSAKAADLRPLAERCIELLRREGGKPFGRN